MKPLLFPFGVPAGAYSLNKALSSSLLLGTDNSMSGVIRAKTGLLSRFSAVKAIAVNL